MWLPPETGTREKALAAKGCGTGAGEEGRWREGKHVCALGSPESREHGPLRGQLLTPPRPPHTHLGSVTSFPTLSCGFRARSGSPGPPRLHPRRPQFRDSGHCSRPWSSPDQRIRAPPAPPNPTRALDTRRRPLTTARPATRRREARTAHRTPRRRRRPGRFLNGSPQPSGGRSLARSPARPLRPSRRRSSTRAPRRQGSPLRRPAQPAGWSRPPRVVPLPLPPSFASPLSDRRGASRSRGKAGTASPIGVACGRRRVRSAPRPISAAGLTGPAPHAGASAARGRNRGRRGGQGSGPQVSGPAAPRHRPLTPVGRRPRREALPARTRRERRRQCPSSACRT